ncbi:hypothetical protein QLQ12_41700 [Actinoplanes sp. NEAU-A12]|uniref:Transcriptional regulator n=1 Tax=Actinoplanes sandaracinus TaxID=3045177 RepID=A0ABT6WZF3_9ACTN|nr:hypothetical protein [Actinoplanes sandaracinus]MDI6105119.1 hypothetical protein [Actinoplanes sandaracinus]
MTARTPYDDDRSPYSRRALARLVLSHQASGLSDAAGSLAVTRYDAFCGAGGRVSEAAALAGHADRLVTSAVIYERERGTSWADIGRHLDLSGPATQERFAPAVEQWRAAFDVPYRLDQTGRKRVPQLPTAAYDPARAVRNLDLWAATRVGYDDKHAVSGGLEPGHDDDEQTGPEKEATEIDGRIRLSHLGGFLDLLSEYALHRPADSARDVVARAMETREDEDGWYSYAMVGVFESLDIRLAVDGDLVGVVVAGAHSPALRLRISTLLDVFA